MNEEHTTQLPLMTCEKCNKEIKPFDIEVIGYNEVLFHLKCYEEVLFKM